MLPDGYPDTYYARTATGVVEHPPLSGETRADFCVIGGGFTGLAAALNLAEQGASVVLLEAERIGYGASGRSGGLVGSGQRKDVLETEELFGYERSRALWDLAEAAKSEIRRRVAEHGIDCDLAEGQLVGVHKRSYLGHAAELAAVLEARYDYPGCRALNAGETRERVATDGFLEGFWDPGALTLHPLNFALGLALAAGAAGVRLHERSRVTGYTQSAPAEVSTAGGKVTADAIVLACNGYLGKLEKRVAGMVMPINNFMVATEPLGEQRALALIDGFFGVHDSRFVVNYFRLSRDYRLLFGGGENYRTGFPNDIRGFVRPYVLKQFPQLADAALDHAWGGTLAITVNRLPHVGRLRPNLWFAQGFSGHGISIASFAGKLLAEAIGGDRRRFDLMAGLPTHRFPGGTLLRYPGMVLAMAYYAFKDRFG